MYRQQPEKSYDTDESRHPQQQHPPTTRSCQHYYYYYYALLPPSWFYKIIPTKFPPRKWFLNKKKKNPGKIIRNVVTSWGVVTSCWWIETAILVLYAGESKTTTQKSQRIKRLNTKKKKQTVGKIKMCTDDDCCERVGISHRPQWRRADGKNHQTHTFSRAVISDKHVRLVARVFIAIANSL